MLLRCLFIICFSAFMVSASQALVTWTPDKGWRVDGQEVKETDKAQFKWSMDQLKEKKYKKAYAGFTGLIEEWPKSGYVAASAYFQGESLYQGGRLMLAFEHFDDVVVSFPEFKNMDQVFNRQFEIASRFQAGEKKAVPFTSWNVLPATSDAVTIYKRIIKHDPFGKYGARAQFEIARIHENAKEYQDAIDAYNNVIDSYGDTPYAVKAKYRKSLAYEKSNKGYSYNDKPLKQAEESLVLYGHRIQGEAEKKEIQTSINMLKEKQGSKFIEIADFYVRKSKPKSALHYYKNALKTYPDHSRAKYIKQQIQKFSK